jgi:predicted transcriptional regulator
MKDIINERLILLATAQECMTDVSDMIEQWDKSQLIVEKSTFETMNVSDKILNLSHQGNQLIEKIRDTYRESLTSLNSIETQNVNRFLEEVHGIFHNILENASIANEVSHKLEEEVAIQKEIEDGIKLSCRLIGERVDEAVACAELVMAEL